MRALAGWGALLLLLMLASHKPLHAGNAKDWGTCGAYPHLGESGSCSAEEIEEAGCNQDTEARVGLSADPPTSGDEPEISSQANCQCPVHRFGSATADQEQLRTTCLEGEGETSEPTGPVRAIGEVSDEYIVRFREYRHASEHRQVLQDVLNVGMWHWVDRVNPASAFPTDFALLRLDRSSSESLLRKLAKLSFVKDVSPQMRFTRSLTTEKSTGRQSQEPPTLGKEMFGARAAGCACDGEAGKRGKGFAVQEGAKTAELEMQESLRGSEFNEVEVKARGRLHTDMSYEDDAQRSWGLIHANVSLGKQGRKLLLQRSQITSMFGAEKLWDKGFTGAKVRMAVFDTGIRADHPHFRNIKERTNWTNEDTLNDNLGHGTFVAGVISSQDSQCLGFAPDAEIYAFRVFTDGQVSYTSWFLDAFNYAIATKMNVLNLSIGGPDYLDCPFVEKVWEMTANNIIMVSAIGNDGPLYGTLNNPADQSDVIGVGGIDYSDHIASFSSRGMSTWEIPHGYGRVKPDIVAYGREVIGSKISSGCKSLSGTSVASPVVAGAVCLLASVVPEQERWQLLNPASMKQALVEGASRLSGPNMFEQGAGRLNLLKSFEILANYKPRASIMPSSLDLTDCPYAWPFCRQPLYAGAMPIIFNATILNGMGVVGYIETAPSWLPSGDNDNLLDIQYTYSDVLWPWTGFLGLHFRIKDEGANFEGTIVGNIVFTVVSPPGRGESKPRKWECVLPLKVAVIPTPLREKRILWDQFHSVRYPPGYIPRDSLDVRNDILDWHGDHLHTNFHGMFDNLRDAGYFLEILGSPLTCFDAGQYGTLLMVDLEDEFYDEEIEKLKEDVESKGLGLIVFADWYHVETMVKMKFFDDNTRSWWTPATGGANIPALNDLLAPFGIAFGDTILNGAYSIGGERAHYASGTDIQRFPARGFVHRFLFQDHSGGRSGITSSRTSGRAQVESPILGAVEAGKGRIAVYGDSNCLDSSHMVSNCYWLLKKLLDFTSRDIRDPVIFPSTNELGSPLGALDNSLPTRRDDVNFSSYSLVLNHPLTCGTDAPVAVQGLKGFNQNELSPDAGHAFQSAFPQQPVDGGFPGQDVTLLGREAVQAKMLTSPDQLHRSQGIPQNNVLHSKNEPGQQYQEGSSSTKKADIEMTETHMMLKNNGGRTYVSQQTIKIGSHLPLGWWNRDELLASFMSSTGWCSGSKIKVEQGFHYPTGYYLVATSHAVGPDNTCSYTMVGSCSSRCNRSSPPFVDCCTIYGRKREALPCVIRILLIVSLWRVRQRKRRRARKGSARSLLNL